jgi:pimeloyl-ACP methyl ester carboxylesterase
MGTMPTLLIPGLNCSARLYDEQIPALWRFGPVIVADHRRGDTIRGIAQNILADAPPHFALVGLSMGGYISFEIMRQAPERVLKLALLDTSSRPDRPEQSERRDQQIAAVEAGRFSEISETLFPLFVRPDRLMEEQIRWTLRLMADETGPEAFMRQLKAIKSRPDSRPSLQHIACPTLVLVGDADQLTPQELSREIAAGIPGSRLVVVPECGHLTTIERPEAVNRALTEWMEA